MTSNVKEWSVLFFILILISKFSTKFFSITYIYKFKFSKRYFSFAGEIISYYENDSKFSSALKIRKYPGLLLSK